MILTTTYQSFLNKKKMIKMSQNTIRIEISNLLFCLITEQNINEYYLLTSKCSYLSSNL